MNPKCTSQAPKDQGKLDICCQVQWETQGKMRHLRLVIFLGELNNQELCGADIGNAYMEAYTHE